jgi:hypothetical protein
MQVLPIVLAALLLPGGPRPRVTGQEIVAAPILGVLRSEFLFDECSVLLNSHVSMSASRHYLPDRPFHPEFQGSSDQEGTIVDLYRLRTPSADALTVLFTGDGAIFSTGVLVRPSARKRALWLKHRALDSKPDARRPSQSTLYFLGIFHLNPRQVVKILLKEDRTGAGNTIYSISYGLSDVRQQKSP